MDIVKGNMGWIEVVVGPMFSGKSEELIRRLRRAEIARQRVQIFKPAIDQRYSANGIVSHSGLEIASVPVTNAEELLQQVEEATQVVGIDEAQFLGERLVDVCTTLADSGKRVIVAGLDTDFMGRPSSRCRSFWWLPRKSPSCSRSASSAGTRRCIRSGCSIRIS